MSRLDRNHTRNHLDAPERTSQLSVGTLLGAVLVCLVVTMLLAFLTWNQTRDLQSSLNARFSAMENRMAQLSTKVDAVSARAAAPAQRGPDPNRVHTIKTDGAPFIGPRDAPITIAEFSDYQ